MPPPEPDSEGQPSTDVVDPLIRAHIYSLCTALGGSSVDDTPATTTTAVAAAAGGKYALGDDALACLKDLRRWLKLYDEKLNRYDVARCLSEMRLVQNDLLEVIGMWGESDTTVKFKHRIVLACIELLAPLTWPLDKTADQRTVNHDRHIPVLQFAQASYKAAMLQHPSGAILKNVVRAALPAMAMPAAERSPRDDGIVRLVLYTLRNVSAITHPRPSEADAGAEIDRSATIAAFAAQHVLDLLLTVAAGAADEFGAQGAVVLEAVYHLVKGVQPEALFLGTDAVDSPAAAASARGGEGQWRGDKDLSALLKREDELARPSGSAAAPTRHNRFGTTLWVERSDGTRSFVSGQGALLQRGWAPERLEKSKKPKKGGKGGGGADRKGVSHRTELDLVVRVDAAARGYLRRFAEDFIDSGFNPLFLAIRKALSRDADRLLDSHARQYFYLVSWFLNAERLRRRRRAAAKKARGATVTAAAAAGGATGGGSVAAPTAATAGEGRGQDEEEDEGHDDSFGVVAAVLNHEFLVALQRKMASWYDLQQWTDLQASMRCFTQILYTVQDMMLSPVEDDQEIAENIQNRLFYEETTMDLVYNICRSYTRQPFRWLDDCTEMVHVHLKLLEKYSQQHEHMFIRSRRRHRARKKTRETNETPEVPGDVDPSAAEAASGESQDEDEEQMAAAGRLAVAERAFDFKRFETKYLNQSCIDTFVALLRYYRELDEAQIMRAIKMLHRIFEKRKEEVLLYRLDLVDLLYAMMQGPHALPRSHPAYKQADTFARHFLRKLFRKLQGEPALFVELLFTKLNASRHFLQYGYDEQLLTLRSRPPRAGAAELHVASSAGLDHAAQIGVAVAALLAANKDAHVEWLKDVLRTAQAQRRLWHDEAAAASSAPSAPSAPPEAGEGTGGSDPTPPDVVITPQTDEAKADMFKDGTLRLLLTLLGAQRQQGEPLTDETVDTKWILPGASLSLQTLAENLAHLQAAANDPPAFDARLIKRKLPPRRKRDALSSDSEGGGEDRFEPGGPTDIHGPQNRTSGSPGRRRKRVKATGEIEMADDKKSRKKKDAPQIRSEKFVTISDDESDSEAERAFFEKERALRQLVSRSVGEDPPMLMGVGRRVIIDSDSSSDDGRGDDVIAVGSGSGSGSDSDGGKGDSRKKGGDGASAAGSGGERRRKKGKSVFDADSTSESGSGGNGDDDDGDGGDGGADRDVIMVDDGGGDDDDDVPVQSARARRRARAISIFSDSE